MSERERGRPREFDLDEALDRAIEVFWRHGYDGTSLSDLTAAMGINRPSLYSAFGNKEQLFHRSVERYAEVDMAYLREALEEPTAARVAAVLLRRNAEAITQPGRPAGCLSIQGGTACGDGDETVARFLAESRGAGERLLAERFARAVAEGDLSPDADPSGLARFVMVVAEGNSVHAAAGARRAHLLAVADVALSAFAATAQGPAQSRGPDPATV